MTRPAPAWAFDPVWETYGFEERFGPQEVLNLLPLLEELEIKTITLDSGWYGKGKEDWNAFTGDFPVNPDVFGREQDFIDFIRILHDRGFRVRLWWVPGVAEKDTRLYADHPDWFYSKVEPSWGGPDDTGDWYLDPTNAGVRAWNRELAERFVSYGVDGFKQDDVYEIFTGNPDYHRAYSALLRDTWETAVGLKPDFVINTCNCGIAQNVQDFPGENQLITSDPVGAMQFRTRAKYLHALDVNGSAILGDHIELTQGDVGREEMADPAFFDQLSDSDFASSVALGMVLETKLTRDPGALYRRWFAIYEDFGFYRMEWVNIPFFSWDPVEQYLLKDGPDLYFSFFTPSGDDFSGIAKLSHLNPGTTYRVYDIVNQTERGTLTAHGEVEDYATAFTGCLVLRFSPLPQDALRISMQ